MEHQGVLHFIGHQAYFPVVWLEFSVLLLEYPLKAIPEPHFCIRAFFYLMLLTSLKNFSLSIVCLHKHILLFVLFGVITHSLHPLSTKLCKLWSYSSNQALPPLTILTHPVQDEFIGFEPGQWLSITGEILQSFAPEQQCPSSAIGKFFTLLREDHKFLASKQPS